MDEKKNLDKQNKVIQFKSKSDKKAEAKSAMEEILESRNRQYKPMSAKSIIKWGVLGSTLLLCASKYFYMIMTEQTIYPDVKSKMVFGFILLGIFTMNVKSMFSNAEQTRLIKQGNNDRKSLYQLVDLLFNVVVKDTTYIIEGIKPIDEINKNLHKLINKREV